MKLGFIGLGRMGGNMVQRLLRARHEVVVYDLDSSAVKAVVSRGAKEAKSIDDLVASLVPTRIIWVMCLQELQLLKRSSVFRRR